MLKEFVDHVYVVNLDKREDRWDQVKKELDRYNIDAERFSAVNGYEHPMADQVSVNPGELGCSLSHIQILEDAIENGHEKIIVFEDDIILEGGFDWRFREYYEQLPDDWNFVYLGGNDRKPLKDITENVKRTTRTLTTHAYMMKKEMFRNVLDTVRNNKFENPVDNVYCSIQESQPVYVFKPHIVIQREGYSDVRGGFRNYDNVLKDL